MSYVGKMNVNASTYHVASTLYGTCDTAADTAAKVAVVDGFDTLETGVTVHIKFTNNNIADNPTLAIKPSSSGTATAAKYIYKYGASPPGDSSSKSWWSGSVVSLTYDGTAWYINDFRDDTSVVQRDTSNSSDYNLLFSNESASTSTYTGTVRKSQNLTFNPGTGGFTQGNNCTASGNCSHAEGYYTSASGDGAHAEGGYSTYAAADITTANTGTYATGRNSHAEGIATLASGKGSHAEGWLTEAKGNYSHAEGSHSTAAQNYSHAEGDYCVANRPYSHAEGNSTTAGGVGSDGGHSEGNLTYAFGNYSHAEGYKTTAAGSYSHAEGSNTSAVGTTSHAEGGDSTASGNYNHAEGRYTAATTSYAHAEGYHTTSSGSVAHAEGYYTVASGGNSHSEGYYTTANHRSQHVFGEYNTIDASTAAADDRGDYIEIVGNGTGSSARSNARTLDWSGNESLAGKIDASGFSQRLLDIIYPIGSIYTSVNSTDPGTLFGGTWEEIKGRFLVGEGTNGASGAELLNLTAGATGGEKDHTLTSDESGTSVHGHGMTQPAFTVTNGAVSNGIGGGALSNGITGGSHTHNWYGYYKADCASGSAKNRLQSGGTTSQANNMGYSATSTHTHSLPAHTHTLPNHTHTVTRTTNAAVSASTAANASNAHNNLPPYLVVYMWKRTA